MRWWEASVEERNMLRLLYHTVDRQTCTLAPPLWTGVVSASGLPAGPAWCPPLAYRRVSSGLLSTTTSGRQTCLTHMPIIGELSGCSPERGEGLVLAVDGPSPLETR